MKIFKSGEIFQGRSHVDMVNQVLGTKYRDWRKCTVELDKFGAHGVISWFVMMDGSENGYGEGWKWKNYLSKDEEQITETNVDRGNIKLYHVQNEEGYHPYRLAFQLDPNQTGNRYKCKFIGAFCLESFALPDLSTMRYKKVSNTFRLCEIGESTYGADDRKFFLTRSSKLSLPIEKLGFSANSYRLLTKSGIRCLGELLEIGMGSDCELVREIREKLRESMYCS